MIFPVDDLVDGLSCLVDGLSRFRKSLEDDLPCGSGLGACSVAQAGGFGGGGCARCGGVGRFQDSGSLEAVNSQQI